MAETKETKNVQQTETKAPTKVKMKALRNFSHHIVPMAGSQQERGTSGGNISAGDVVYKSPDDHKWRRANDDPRNLYVCKRHQ